MLMIIDGDMMYESYAPLTRPATENVSVSVPGYDASFECLPRIRWHFVEISMRAPQASRLTESRSQLDCNHRNGRSESRTLP